MLNNSNAIIQCFCAGFYGRSVTRRCCNSEYYNKQANLCYPVTHQMYSDFKNECIKFGTPTCYVEYFIDETSKQCKRNNKC